MANFHVVRLPRETLAVHACRYILQRVIHDVDFAWHMRGTETMDAAIRGVCEATGESPDDLLRKIEAGIARNQAGQYPRVTELVRQIERLQRRAGELAHDPFALPDEPSDNARQRRALMRIEEHIEYVRRSGIALDIDAIQDALDARFEKARN